MASIFDIPQDELIEKVAEELKQFEELRPPAYATYAKTGANKERAPVRRDWWYIRAASILRKLYKMGCPIGVSKLRTVYGSKKHRGHKTEEFRRASGNIIRKILQAMEKAGLANQAGKGVRKGRIITGKGRSLLDKTATAIQKGKPAPAPQKEPIQKAVSVTEKQEKAKQSEDDKSSKAALTEDAVKKTRAVKKAPVAKAARIAEEKKKESEEEKKEEMVPSTPELAAKKK